MLFFDGYSQSSSVEVALRSERLARRSRERAEEATRRVQATRSRVCLTARMILKSTAVHNKWAERIGLKTID